MEQVETWNGFHCDLCGKHEVYGPCSLTLTFGYGSEYDGERLTLDLCAECADRIMKELPPWSGRKGGYLHEGI